MINIFLKKIRNLPIHPQWLVFKDIRKTYPDIAESHKGKRVLDIGCGEQPIKNFLSSETEYIGLDYYETATNWYKSRPHIFGDAQSLPFVDSCVDTVLLFSVLEHLPKPDDCLQEIARVLKPRGKCILQVPFLYPVHDAPLDFQRWTNFAISAAAEQNNFIVAELRLHGKPLETAALLTNIAIGKSFANWAANKNPAVVIGLFLLLLVPWINLLGWIFNFLSSEDQLMPYLYHCVLEKRTDENVSFRQKT